MKKLDLLEVHFTLDHDDIDCPDHWFALMPNELREMMKALNPEDKRWEARYEWLQKQ